MLGRGGHNDEAPRRRRGGGPFKTLFIFLRMCLSLTIMLVLFLGVFQAYKSFSGIDPLHASPKAVFENILASKDAYDLVASVLTAHPQDSLNKAKSLLSDQQAGSLLDVGGPQVVNDSPLLYKFAIVTDSHTDNTHLAQALKMAKDAEAQFIVGTGDYTNVGTLEELEAAKEVFDSAGLPYYLTSGDHDLWDARNKKLDPSTNFKEVFGNPYQAFTFKNTRFLILYNSDDYEGMDSVQLQWAEDEIDRIKNEKPAASFAFVSTPLYHPSSDHKMGRLNEKLANQADHLISLMSEAGVKEVFAGDVHFFSRYQEPKTGLKMTVVGAVTEDRNAQSPRFAIVDVHEDGSYNIQDTEIK